MAEIFLARQTGPAGFDKQVVIKRVLPNCADNEDFVRLFLDEARLAARLSHPNIVQVFDFGEDSGMYYLAMEYLHGLDLAAIQSALRRQGRPMPWHIAALIVSSACEALYYAHTCTGEDGHPLGIIHRDISPSNLFVTYQGAVKVLDFGIAKAEDNLRRTEAGVIRGKYPYMSPEQVCGDLLDARSDIFALGAVLHECLVGRPVFLRRSPLAIFNAILKEPIPRPSECGSLVPKGLEDIAMRALERDVSARWHDAREMREALDAYLAAHTSGSPMSLLSKFLRELNGAPSEERPPPVNPPPHGESLPTTPDPRVSKGLSAPAPPRAPPEREAVSFPAVTAIPPGAGNVPTSAGGDAPRPIPKPSRRSGAGVLAAVGALALILAGLARLPPKKTSGVPAPEPPATLVPGPSPDARWQKPPEPARSPSPTPTPAPTPAPVAPRPTFTAAPKRSLAPPSSALGGAGTAPPEPHPGFIDVNCIPWCEIYIDGVDTRRHSPARGIAVEPGKHEMRVLNPPSGLERVLTIEIKAGASTSLGPVYLRKR